MALTSESTAFERVSRERNGAPDTQSIVVARDPQAIFIYRALLELKRLGADWDTFGSPPIQDVAFESALRLLEQCSVASVSLLPQHVSPVSGGGIQFEWMHAHRELELEILPNGSCVALLVEDEKPVAEVPFPATRTGVTAISGLLAWLFE